MQPRPTLQRPNRCDALQEPVGPSQGAAAVTPVVRMYATESMTLEEVGYCLGITRERVRQIETAALRKVAVKLAGRGLSSDRLLDT